MLLSSAGMGFFDERILSHDRYLPNTKSAIYIVNIIKNNVCGVITV